MLRWCHSQRVLLRLNATKNDQTNLEKLDLEEFDLEENIVFEFDFDFSSSFFEKIKDFKRVSIRLTFKMLCWMSQRRLTLTWMSIKKFFWVREILFFVIRALMMRNKARIFARTFVDSTLFAFERVAFFAKFKRTSTIRQYRLEMTRYCRNVNRATNDDTNTYLLVAFCQGISMNREHMLVWVKWTRILAMLWLDTCWRI